MNAQLVKALGGPTTQIPVALSTVLANLVVANTLDVQPTGPHSAGSNSPFYYALLLMLAGFVGMDIIYLGLDMVTGRSTATPRIERLRGDAVPLSPAHSWSTRVLLSLGLAIIAGLLEVGVAVGMLNLATDRIVPLMAFGMLNMATDRIVPLMAFGMLAIFTSAIFTLFFLTAFGTPGLLMAIIL